MTRLWLVRHGPTHAKAMVGWTDLPADLTDTAALARLSAHLPADAPVISSDLARAVATADALAPRRRLPHDPALREIHFGQWEMRGFAEIEAETPEHIRAFWDSPGDIAPPGGESWNALTTRLWPALDRLALHGPEGLSPDAALAHRIDNLSVTCLSFGPPARVHSVNHLP